MKKLVVFGVVGLALAGAGGYVAYDQVNSEVHTESLCVGDTSDAAQIAKAGAVALVQVDGEGRFVGKGEGSGITVFTVRPEEVFKGTLPSSAEVWVPSTSADKLVPGSRYEVALNGPDSDGYLVRFSRPAAAGKSVADLAAHWKAEQAKKFVEPPCGDTSVVD